MDRLSSKPTSHDVTESFDPPVKEMPEDVVEDVKQSDEAKDKDEIDRLLNEHMQQLKHALNNTYKEIAEGVKTNEQGKR